MSPFYLPFLSSTTLLAGPVADTRSSLEQPDPPFLAASCTALRPMLQASAILEPMLARSMGEQTGDLLPLLSTDLAGQAGLDGDGAFSITQWPDHVVVNLPFAGDSSQARALLARLAPAATIAETDGSWSGQSQRHTMTASLANGTLHLEVASPSKGRPVAPGAIFDGLGDEPGCAAFTALIPDPSKKSRPQALVIALPSGQPTAQMRVAMSQPPPALLQSSQASNVQVHTEATPMAVATLGVDALELLELLPMPEGKAPPLEDIRKMQGKVSVPPGTTGAVFKYEDSVELAFVIPIASPSGRPLSARKISTYMHQAKDGPAWSDRYHFSAPNTKTPLLGVIQDGRLLVSSRQDLLDQMAADQGQAWITPELSAYQASWPVAVLFRPPPGFPSADGASLLAGLRGKPDYWELSATSAETRGAPSAEVVGATIAALAAPQLAHRAKKAPNSEPPTNEDARQR